MLRQSILSFMIALLGGGAWAAPASLTYQGRILKSDGRPLEYSNVSFQFEITTTNGSCVLYREQVNGVNMTNSNGVFDVKIGASHSYPGSASFSILDSFSNGSALTCDGGTVFNPTGTDGRLLRVQFHDGTSWKVISPDSSIRSVPYAAYAASSNKLGAYVADDFILRSQVNNNASCMSGSYLTWNAGTQRFGCEADPGGGGGAGTVTELFSANSYLTVTNSTTTPTLTLNVGTSANTVAAGNDSRLSNARTPTGSAGGDLGGSYPNPSVAKIQGVGVDFSTAPASGQVLTFDGSNWVSQALPAASSGTVTGITAGTGLTGGTINTSGTIGLGTALAGLNSLATNGYIQRTGAGTYTTTSGNIAASNNTLVLRDGSGVGSFYGVGISGGTSGAVTLQAPLISATYSLTLPDSQGAANQVMANDGNGLLSWVNVPAAPGSACVAGNVLTYNGSAFTCVPDQVGSAGGGIVSLNSQTGSSQSFGNGTTGNAPAWSSGSDVHTLNIPYARNGGVTAGLISKTEYDTFNGKQNALTYVPLNPTNNLSDLNDADTARTNLGLGTAAVKNAPASGNASTAEVVLGDDTRLTNSRAPSGSAGGDLGGSYPNPDVNRIKGVGLSMTSLTTGNFLKYNGSNWINAMIAPSDVTGLTTALNSKLDQSQISGTCAANSTLVFSSVSGTWTCTNIGIADSQVTFASKSAKTFLAAPTGGAGAPTFRTIAAADLPSTVTDALWTASGSDIYRSTGNVGMGTPNPSQALHVFRSSASAQILLETDGGGGGTPAAYMVMKDGSAAPGAQSFGFKSQGGLFSLNVLNDAATSSVTRVMSVLPSGNVGIGTSAPASALHIGGATPILKVQDANSGAASLSRTMAGVELTAYGMNTTSQYTPALKFMSTDPEFTTESPKFLAGIVGRAAQAYTTNTSGAMALDFLTTGADPGANSVPETRMTIAASGNVGIGTISPADELHVVGAIRAGGSTAPAFKIIGVRDGTTATSGYLEFNSSSGTRSGYVGYGASSNNDLYIFNDKNAGIHFYTNGTRAMGISNGGNLGIDTLTPASKISIGGTGSTAWQMAVYGQGTTSATYGINHRDSAGTAVFYTRDDGAVYAAGPVAIGLSPSTSYGLRMAGNLAVTGSSGSTCVIGNGTSGTSCTSDARLKENVVPISDALSKVMQIRGVEFDWNNKTQHAGKHAIGVIAQEVEKVFPDLVNIEKESGYRVVDYAGLVSPLIESTKDLYGMCKAQQDELGEQKRKLASLEEKLEHERQRNDDLERRIQDLESLLQKK